MGFTARTEQEINDLVESLWGKSHGDRKVTIDRCNAQVAEFTIDQMYEFVELDFARLKAVSDFFGTLNLKTSSDSSDGCETCDYGSSYCVTFTVTE